MKSGYVEILQQLLISEQLRLTLKSFEDDDKFYTNDIEYSINDLGKIYFALEEISW